MTRFITSVLVALLILLGYWQGSHQGTALPPTDSGATTFFSNQTRHDLRKLFVGAIDRAEKSVLLSIYSISDEPVMAALVRAAERGLPVTIMYDPGASWLLKKWTPPGIELMAIEGKGLMHRKILIIDQRETWIGSANMTTASLRVHGNSVLALNSPDLAQSLEARLLNPSLRNPLHQRLRGQDIELYLLPEDRDALPRLIGLIDEARKTVRVAMYTWTHPKLTDAIIRAHQRGVDVQAVIDRSSSQGSSKEVLERLVKAGLDVAVDDGAGLLHHKLVWIDGRTIALGSANWTRSAFRYNADCVCVVNPLTEEQEAWMQALWKVIYAEASAAV